MKNLLNSITEFFANLPDLVRKRKLLVLLSFIVVTVIIGFIGLKQVKFDFTVEGWFKKDAPVFVAYNRFHAQFGSEDGVMIVYKAKDGDVFSAKSLEAVKGIRDELRYYRSKLKEGEKSSFDHVVKINCLINASILTAEGDMLLSKQLVGEKVPTSQEELDKIRKTAESQKGLPLQYFSKDMKYGAMLIETDFGAIPLNSDEQSVKDLVMDDMTLAVGGAAAKDEVPRFKPTDMADYIALNAAIKTIIEKPEYANVLEYHVIGNTAESEFQTEMGKEMGMLYLAAILIMIVLLWFLFRSFSGVVWPLVIIIISTIWAIGSAGLLGLPASPFIILTVLLILTVGMADAVHLMSGYMFFRNANNDHRSALRKVYGSAGTAMLLTCITNIVGVLALNITPIVPIQNFAIMSALGIVFALIISYFILPLLLDLWSPVSKAPKTQKGFIERIIPNFADYLQKVLGKIVPFVEKRPVTIMVPFFVLFAFCVYGGTMVKVDSSLTTNYPEGSKWRQNIELIDQKMAGSSQISLYMDLGKEDGLQDPKVLNAIDELQQKFEKKYSKYVVTTSSIVNVVKDSYQKLNDGKEDMYVVPSDEKVLSQTLFLFNNSSPEQRRRLVDDNYQKANISVTLHNFGSYEYNRVFDQMEMDITESLNTIKDKYPDAQLTITGIFAMAMRTSDSLVNNELQSFGTALLAISIILLVIFGSFRAGLISLIPNLIPSFLTFGLLGLLDVPLDFYTMMLAPIIIGISVDDTVHFITQYRTDVVKDGNIKRALKHTMIECGQAITFTTLILGLGFGIMSIASTTGLANMGKFGVLAIFSGFVCEMFLTPSLILLFNLTFHKKAGKQLEQTH